MFKKLLVAALLVASASAQSLPVSTPWTKQEMAMEGAFQAMLFYNWRQSSNIHRYTPAMPSTDINGNPMTYMPGYKERYTPIDFSPLVKKNASQGAINLTYLLTSIGHVLVTNAIKDHTGRAFWQTTSIGFEAFIIGSNYGAGVRVKW